MSLLNAVGNIVCLLGMAVGLAGLNINRKAGATAGTAAMITGLCLIIIGAGLR